jgi:hypothetical protein
VNFLLGLQVKRGIDQKKMFRRPNPSVRGQFKSETQLFVHLLLLILIDESGQAVADRNVLLVESLKVKNGTFD